MVNFYNEYDKNNLNMMGAQIKIIDFGFATRLEENCMTSSIVGTPNNVDPLILKKMSERQNNGIF